MRRHWFIVAMWMWLCASPVFANTDINNLFDARSTGMGATGVAFLDSAGAIPINPALLDQIDKLTLTLDGTLIAVQPTAPYRVTHANPDGSTYQNWETVRQHRTLAPLFLLGGAYRVVDRVVVGAAVYPLVGMGTISKYTPAPELLPGVEVQNKLEAGLLEIGVPVSVRILDNLSVAAMWRITSLSQSATQPVPGTGPNGLSIGPTGDPQYAKLDVSGWNFGGLQLGVLYKALPFLRFGFSYRSKVKTNGTGTTQTTIGGQDISLDTSTAFINPHAFRAGAALSVLQDRLLFAFDLKYLLYAEAYKTIDTTIVMNGTPVVNSVPAHWKNSYAAFLGAEFAALPILRIRAGYEMVTSATPKDYATSAMAPPGISNGFTLGVGFKVIDHLSIDAAAAYIAYSTKVSKATPDNAGVGTYASNTGQFALSATYRM